MSTRWIADLLEETTYKIYLENNPKMVEGIRILLAAGKPKSEIKKWCKSVIGECKTLNYIEHMIDYVNKQVQHDEGDTGRVDKARH